MRWLRPGNLGDLVDNAMGRKERSALRNGVDSSFQQRNETGELELQWFTRVANDRNVDDRLLAVAGLLVETRALNMTKNGDRLAHEVDLDHSAELADPQGTNLLLGDAGHRQGRDLAL